MKLIQINFEHFFMVQCPEKGRIRIELCFGCKHHRGTRFSQNIYYVKCTKEWI